MLDTGLPDRGTSSKSGVAEQGINLEIALKLQALLEQCGANVIMTRSTDSGIYGMDASSIKQKKVSDMVKRVELGNTEGVDIYISIHLNYFEQQKYRGWQTFYQTTSEESKALATIVQEQLNDNFNDVNNRSPMALQGVFIMDKVKIPTIIIECGFLSNFEEEKLLQEDVHQQRLAWGIFIGIQNYFANK